jgi:Flp pilus assembly protein TadD
MTAGVAVGGGPGQAFRPWSRFGPAERGLALSPLLAVAGRCRSYRLQWCVRRFAADVTVANRPQAKSFGRKDLPPCSAHSRPSVGHFEKCGIRVAMAPKPSMGRLGRFEGLLRKTRGETQRLGVVQTLRSVKGREQQHGAVSAGRPRASGGRITTMAESVTHKPAMSRITAVTSLSPHQARTYSAEAAALSRRRHGDEIL